MTVLALDVALVVAVCGCASGPVKITESNQLGIVLIDSEPKPKSPASDVLETAGYGAKLVGDCAAYALLVGCVFLIPYAMYDLSKQEKRQEKQFEQRAATCMEPLRIRHPQLERELNDAGERAMPRGELVKTTEKVLRARFSQTTDIAILSNGVAVGREAALREAAVNHVDILFEVLPKKITIQHSEPCLFQARLEFDVYVIRTADAKPLLWESLVADAWFDTDHVETWMDEPADLQKELLLSSESALGILFSGRGPGIQVVNDEHPN